MSSRGHFADTYCDLHIKNHVFTKPFCRYLLSTQPASQYPIAPATQPPSQLASTAAIFSSKFEAPSVEVVFLESVVVEAVAAMPTIDLWSRFAMSLWWLRWGIDLVVSSGKTTLAEEMPIARAMQECADEPSDSEVTAEGDEGDCEAKVKRRR